MLFLDMTRPLPSPKPNLFVDAKDFITTLNDNSMYILTIFLVLLAFTVIYFTTKILIRELKNVSKV